MIRKFLIATCLAFVCALAFSPTLMAVAQEAIPKADRFAPLIPNPSPVIGVGELLAPWLEALIGIAVTVLMALLGWIAALIRARTGVVIEQARMNTFQTALTNAAGLLVAKGITQLDHRMINVRDPRIAMAIRYVNESAPDAIAKFGVTEDAIAQRIIAKLGLVQNAVPVVNVSNEAALK